MSIVHNTLTGAELHVPFNAGLDANKAASPTVGMWYYATDTKILYYCHTATTWTVFRGLLQDADQDTLIQVEESADEDKIRMDTGGVERLVLDSNGLDAKNKIILTGGQIAFPGTAVPSADPNILDDYEEGSYVATLVCGTSGTITIAGGSDTLSYTKIGRVVHVSGYISTSAISSPVGSLRLNLPFTSSQLTEESDQIAGSIAIGGGAGNVESFCMFIVGGAATYIIIAEQLGTGCDIADDVSNHIDASTYLRVGFSYIVE